MLTDTRTIPESGLFSAYFKLETVESVSFIKITESIQFVVGGVGLNNGISVNCVRKEKFSSLIRVYNQFIENVPLETYINQCVGLERISETRYIAECLSFNLNVN